MGIACFVDCSKGNNNNDNDNEIFLGNDNGSISSDSSSNNKRSLSSTKSTSSSSSSNDDDDDDGVVMKMMSSSSNNNSSSSTGSTNNNPMSPPNKNANNITKKINTPPFLRRVRRRTSITPYKLAIFSLEDHNFGKVLKSRQLSKILALGVTSTKFSPSAAFAILGFGARSSARSPTDPSVANIYRISDMNLVTEIRSNQDDLNIALFHPLCGYGFIYGTRHGRIRRIQIGNNNKIIAKNGDGKKSRSKMLC